MAKSGIAAGRLEVPREAKAISQNRKYQNAPSLTASPGRAASSSKSTKSRKDKQWKCSDFKGGYALHTRFVYLDPETGEASDGKYFRWPTGIKPKKYLYSAHSWQQDGVVKKMLLITEGEKTADASYAAICDLTYIGVVGTCGTGANPDDEVLLSCLQVHPSVAEIRLAPDNDAPGRKHMARIAQQISRLAGEMDRNIAVIKVESVTIEGKLTAGDLADIHDDQARRKHILEKYSPWEPRGEKPRPSVQDTGVVGQETILGEWPDDKQVRVATEVLTDLARCRWACTCTCTRAQNKGCTAVASSEMLML